jgi:hypothetical protein
MERGNGKNSTSAKLLENSSTTLEECEYLGSRVSQLRNQVNDMGANVLKNVDLTHLEEIFKRKIEDKMEKLMDQKMEKWMDQKMKFKDEI